MKTPKLVREIYDFDNLHIEIDNIVAELKLDPFDALDIWHLGIEQWNKRQAKP